MRIKSYFAKSVDEAMAQARAELGDRRAAAKHAQERKAESRRITKSSSERSRRFAAKLAGSPRTAAG